MQTKDHKMLAGFLISETGCELPVIYIKAFILGNIESDKNLFTYLHGLTEGVKFHGHNYENILPVMEKLFDSLYSKRYWGTREYYHLGKLLYYVTDAFTFPHNRIFKGNLKEHCRYEKELHKRFVNILQKPQKQLAWKEKTGNCLNCIKNLHEEYLQQAGNYEIGCKYILKAAIMLLQEETGIIWQPDFSRCEKEAG